MSIVGAVLTMIAVAVIYVGVIFLSKSYNHGGRDPIDPFFSVSQWNPNRVEITGTCVVPLLPGTCVIEGLTGAYQAAKHWCNVEDSGPCIDPDTGENVKNNPIPFLAVCSDVPYCGWSQGILTFDGTNFVNVTITPPTTPSGNPVTVITNSTLATVFYMERISVGDKGLTRNQNGTIARFYMFNAGAVYVLSYNNSYKRPGTTEQITQLTVQRSDNLGQSYLTFFALAETMPTSVSQGLPTPPSAVARKILVFGGANRQSDPPVEELKDFNEHDQQKFWNAAINSNLVMITATVLNSPFYGFPENTYQTVLNSWGQSGEIGTLYLISQDFIEDRLGGVNGRGRAFYNWV